MAKRWRRRVGHVPHGVPYSVENSRWFLRLLVALRIIWIDFDGHVTKDGVPVCGHWGLIRKNGFFLPRWFRRKYGRNARIKDVLYEDLIRLRTFPISFRGRRRYRFMSLWDAIILAVRLNRKIMYEQKGDIPFTEVWFWETVEEHMVNSGMRNDELVVATLPTMAHAGDVMHAAHTAGRQTMVIRAQDGVPRSWEPNMTWYRGRIKWVNK